MDTPTLDDLMNAFDSWMRRNRRPTTRRHYSRCLREFQRWIHEIGDPPLHTLNHKLIERDFIAWYWDRHEGAHGRRPSDHGLKLLVVSLKAFFKWLDRDDLLVDWEGKPYPNPMTKIDTPKVGQRPNDALKGDEIDALLEAIATPRERIVIHLLMFAGLRESELRNLRWANISFSRHEETITVEDSKSDDGVREVMIVPALLPTLKSWMIQQKSNGVHRADGHVILNAYGQPYTKPKGIYLVVKTVATRAGLRANGSSYGTSISPHTLRRTFGSWLLNEGVRIEAVSKLLGHSSTTVTEKSYAKLLPQTIRAEVLRALRGESHAA